MELIPILSLIILVSTISTFILAVGAYILYKVRERRGRAAKLKAPETLPAELIEPASLLSEQRPTKSPDRGLFIDEKSPTMATVSDMGKSTLFKSTLEKDGTQTTRSTFLTQGATNYSEDHYRRRATEATESGVKPSPARTGRFLRYTSDGEQEDQERKRNREDNLQWR